MIGFIMMIPVGILLIIGRKTMMRGVVDWNKNFGIKFQSEALKFGEIMCIVVGLLSISLGILGLLGIIK